MDEINNTIDSIIEVHNSLGIEDYSIKTVIIGDPSVGKTNMLQRFVDDNFIDASQATVGVEMSYKTFKINNKIVKINFWDTAGQERYKSITSAYYKGSKGALLVFDLTNLSSFNNVEKWYYELKEFSDKNIVAILIGNKCDLIEKRQVNKEEAIKLSKNLRLPYIETSAKDSTHIDLAFKQLINGILLFNKEIFIKLIRNPSTPCQDEIEEVIKFDQKGVLIEQISKKKSGCC